MVLHTYFAVGATSKVVFLKFATANWEQDTRARGCEGGKGEPGGLYLSIMALVGVDVNTVRAVTRNAALR